MRDSTKAVGQLASLGFWRGVAEGDIPIFIFIFSSLPPTPAGILLAIAQTMPTSVAQSLLASKTRANTPA